MKYASDVNSREYVTAHEMVERKIKELRHNTPELPFDKDKLAEVEVNQFFYEGESVDRVMIVLRTNGCQHYKTTGGCSMCSHLNGSPLHDKITHENYVRQWNSVLDGTFIENGEGFNLNDYPVICVYNLGSLLNVEEIQYDTLRYIFTTLNEYKGVKKVIIESRVEYVNEEVLKVIKECYDGIVEVGIGVESTNDIIRELCHHKGVEDMHLFKGAVETLHKYGMRALAYVNFKPIFLTESEAIEDAIQTSVDCFNEFGFDAVSVEPTSLQENSLANYMYNLGLYRVPWLWSITDIVEGIYSKVSRENLDIRIGGYFDEEVLSGSQGAGFEGRNEIFPHMTSSNCFHCSASFIEAIKEFNKTYDLNELKSVKHCPYCYKLWQDSKKILDSRSIIERIHDVFGGDGR